MPTARTTILSTLLLSLTGCVAYDPYPVYPTYREPVVVAPPPIAIYPGYRYGPWHRHGWDRPHWGQPGWGRHGGGRAWR